MKFDLKTLLTGGPKPIWIRYMFILGVATMITRLVLDLSLIHI